MALTPKQTLFVKEYLIDLNATGAAERAGYSSRSRSEIGYQLLQKTSIQEAIQHEFAERARNCGITAERVLREIACIAFQDIGDLGTLNENGSFKFHANISDDARKTISSIKIRREARSGTAPEATIEEFRRWDKISALDKLMKHLGLLIERVDISGEVRQRIIEEVIDEK